MKRKMYGKCPKCGEAQHANTKNKPCAACTLEAQVKRGRVGRGTGRFYTAMGGWADARELNDGGC